MIFRLLGASAWHLAHTLTIGLLRGAVVSYVIAIASSAVAFGLSLLLVPADADPSVAALLFLAAVGVSGWYGGLVPALVATGLGVLAIDYVFESPRYQLQITDIRTVTDLAAFLLVAVLLGSLNARVRHSNTRLRSERDRAQAAVEARDDLMATVSHALRTPLTAIKTSVYSLRDPASPPSDETRDQLLTTIEAESDRLARFVAEALAMRGLENGQSPRYLLTDPAEVAAAVLDRCAPLLGTRPLAFGLADDLPPARLDPGLLEQALTALVENVAMHTPADAPWSIHGAVQGRDLRLEVSDAGPGIPPNDRERIFTKYERLVPTSSGAGLGLAIARAAVETQGGRLWVEDGPLGGARFVVLLRDVVADGE